MVLQVLLTPETFGVYGHYRAAAIGDASGQAMVFAGRAACSRCHASQLGVLTGGKHARLGCEACHGALGDHAASPKAHKPVRLDTNKLCPACHERLTSRPSWLKQVKSAEHSGGEACDICHQPHAPQM